MGKRISDPSLTRTNFSEAIANNGELLVDWAELITSRPIGIKFLGNSWVQGSNDGSEWVNAILNTHNYIRLSTDGGITWRVISLQTIETLLSLIITNGDGTTFLANDGTYKTPSEFVLDNISHADLQDLEYENSGHIGFEPARNGDQNYVTDDELAVIQNTSGINSGDQVALEVPITDVDELYDAENVEDALKEVKLIADEAINTSSKIHPITLPAYASVSQRCSNAIEGDDYPEGWVISAGDSEYDLKITHGLNKYIVNVNVFEINADLTERMLPPFSAAYTGVLQNSKNELLIEGLTQDLLSLRIELVLR